jgi:plastocyanin
MQKKLETTQEGMQPTKRSRRPLSALGKVSLAGLIASGVLIFPFGFFAWSVFVVSAALLVVAGLVWRGFRWAPILGTLLSGLVLVFLLVGSGYPIYHLTHPRNADLQPAAAQFPIFIGVVIVLAVLILAFGGSLGAAVQNYTQRQPQRPRWLTPALTGLLGLVIGVILIAGIGEPTTSAATTTTGGEATVHLSAASFSPTSVIVSRGTKLRVENDAGILHVLANGSWDNNVPRPQQESGAPLVNNVQISSGSVELGPFTTSGTFHIFCSVHAGMNLMVFVP